jgi:hypothetical protein
LECTAFSSSPSLRSFATADSEINLLRGPKTGVHYNLSPEVLGRDDFLKLLCKLPAAIELGVSVAQMRIICGASDVWNALGATLAYIIQLSTTHAPKNKNGKKRPGAQDLWQAPYLGVVEVFVTSDGPMLEAVSKISALLRHPRSVVCTKDFFERLETGSWT